MSKKKKAQQRLNADSIKKGLEDAMHKLQEILGNAKTGFPTKGLEEDKQGLFRQRVETLCKATHAYGQAATAWSKLHEVGEMEARLIETNERLDAMEQANKERLQA